MRFRGELDDLDKLKLIADKWGYGNAISFLKDAWSKKLQDGTGFTKETADMAAGHVCTWCSVDSRTGEKITE